MFKNCLVNTLHRYILILEKLLHTFFSSVGMGGNLLKDVRKVLW